MGGARDIAVSAVGAVLQRGAYSDTVLDILISRDKTLSELDRALATELTYGVLRNLLRLDHIISHFSNKKISSIDRDVLNILRTAVYQIVFLDKIPPYAAVNEAVNLAAVFGKRSAGSFVNGVLRAALGGIDDIRYPDPKSDPISYISTYYSLPTWLSEFFIDTFGFEKTEKIARAQNERPPTTLRTNSLMGDRNNLIEIMKGKNLSVRPAKYSPFGVIVEGGGAISRHDLFKEGYFSLQDEASQLVPIILDPKPDMRILDLCAAPGLKGTFAAELMGDRGSIISVEINRNRADSIKENKSRLGINSVKVISADAKRLPIKLNEKFDRVLIDPPCSALGIIRRSPEIKWRLKIDNIRVMIKNQRLILEEGAAHVKRGGILVYSVCTINPAEGKDMIGQFLGDHPDFSIDDISPLLSKGSGLIDDDKAIFTPPYIFDESDPDKPDGFFVARLKM